jgi:MATE family multidrug resistance protein
VYLSMLATTLAALVDTAALGRYGTVPLAAFAVAFGVFGPATAALTGAVRGVMPFVAESAGDRPRLAGVLRDAVGLSLVVGAAGAAVVACTPIVARLSGVPAGIVAELRALPLLLAAALLVSSIGFVATFSLTGLGRGRWVMWSGVSGAATTAVLSPVLILGPGGLPRLGIVGAGVSLLVANLVTAALGIRGLARPGPGTGRPPLRPDARQMLRMARVGVPTAGTVLLKFGTLGFLALVVARLGAVHAAAHNVADAVVRLTFTAAVAIGLAVVPLVAGPASRGDTAVVRRGVAAGVLVLSVTFVVLETGLLLARHPLVGLFSPDPAVRAQVMLLFPIVLAVVFLDGLQAVFGFGLTALKRTGPSLLLFMAGYGMLALVAVPVAGWQGLTGIWVALAVTNLLLATGQAAVFRRESGRGHEAPARKGRGSLSAPAP